MTIFVFFLYFVYVFIINIIQSSFVDNDYYMIQ